MPYPLGMGKALECEMRGVKTVVSISDYTKASDGRWTRKDHLGEPILEISKGMKTANEFLSDLKNAPQTEFLVDQLLPDTTRAFMIICGRPEIGKTNLSLYAAFCLAKGTPFFSFKTKPCKVGYLFMEGGAPQIGNRVEKLSKHFVGIPDNLHIQSAEPIPLYPKGRERLEGLVNGLDVCFVDALKYIIPGDYMKPADVLKGLNTLQIIQENTGVVFALVGHIRKPSQKAISQPEDYWTELKGPTEYLEMANSGLLLTRPRHARNSQGQFTSSPDDRELYFIKARDADRELQPIKLKFDWEELRFKPQIEEEGVW